MILPLILAGTLFVGSTGPAKGAEAIELERSQKFASCLVDRAPRVVERGFAENWAPENFTLGFGKRTMQECMSGIPTLAIDSPDLRYVLALEWLRESNSPSIADFSTVPPLKHDLFHMPILRRVNPGETFDKSNADEAAFEERRKIFSAVGECVERADPKRVEQFLNGGQAAGPSGLILPLLSRCAPTNSQLRFSSADLIGLLALSYVRLRLAAEGVGNKEAAE